MHCEYWKSINKKTTDKKQNQRLDSMSKKIEKFKPGSGEANPREEEEYTKTTKEQENALN